MPKMTGKVAFIMAGGIGERFFPITSENHPKYAMLSGENRSFLRDTFNRLASVYSPNSVGVITAEKHRKLVKKILPELNSRLLLCEPMRKNTAAAVTWGTITAETLFGSNVSVAFFPADAMIRNRNAFVRTCRKAIRQSVNTITLIGIPPDRPATGYGYIQIASLPDPSGVSAVRSFKEKPAPALAKRYLRSGKYLWNSGMFFWTPEIFFKEMKQQCPGYLDKWQPLRGGRASISTLATVFKTLPSQPIDKQLIEKVKKLSCVQASFSWDDIGTWEALRRMSVSGDGNLRLAKTLMIDCKGTTVYSENLNIIACGLTDLVIAEKDGVLMICPSADSEDVKRYRSEWLKKC